VSSCQYCGNKAQYYCKNCGKILCADHVIISTIVYYCKQCDSEVYEPVCDGCGKEAEYLRSETVYRCEWCKTPTVVDGFVYHQQLPEKIFSSIARINSKVTELLSLTKRYHSLVNLVWEVRIAKIALFPEVEDELSLLRGKIDNFIGKVKKFIDGIFVKINKKLQTVHYLRSQNLSDLEPVEELLSYIEKNYSLLEKSMKLRIESIEEDFAQIQEKVAFLEYQLSLLKSVHMLIPNEEREELIAIIPRVWIKKNGKLPKKYIFVLTNNNIYLLREKGLFNVNLKLKETLNLSRVRIKSISESLFYGKIFKFSTHMARYSLFGRDVPLIQLRNYFKIYNEYFKHASNDLSIIKELTFYTLTVKDLRLSINKQLNNLRVSLLKKREIKKEIMYRDSLEAREQQILQRLANIKRKIYSITQNRPKNRYQSPKVIDNLLRKLMQEQSRLIEEIQSNREKIRKIDDLWGEYNSSIEF